MGSEKNPIEEMLIDLQICDRSSIAMYHPHVRDREDVKVMRCAKSGVIFLSKSDHMSDKHYREQKDLSGWSAQTRQEALIACRDDDNRRAKQYSSYVKDNKWLDVGTGVGGILDLMKDDAKEVGAVELHSVARNILIELGYKVFEDIDHVENEYYDVVTMFHVFEHMTDPLGCLRKVSDKMKDGSLLIIEVPHARDILLESLNNDAFKKFTLWSEHIILHTRESLKTMLNRCGYVDIHIEGYQRFPLANHLHWLAEGKPGGHKRWTHLVDSNMDDVYSKFLKKIDQTDTLICMAKRAVR